MSQWVSESVSEWVSEIIEYRAAASQLKMKTIKEMKPTPKPQLQNEDNHKTEGHLKDEDHLKKHWNQLLECIWQILFLQGSR